MSSQRYFPEFFPSCYSEKRLNLKRLFSEVGRRAEDAELATPEEVRLLRDSGLVPRGARHLAAFQVPRSSRVTPGNCKTKSAP